MADTVDTLVLRNSDTFYAVRLTNYSDGTGESAVVKVDVSTLTGPNGATTTQLQLHEAHWAVKDGSVQILFDATSPDEALHLSGNGYLDLRPVSGMKDPRSSGVTGDIKLTTKDFAAGSSYNIVLTFKKKN